MDKKTRSVLTVIFLVLFIITSGCFKEIKNARGVIYPIFTRVKRVPPCKITGEIEISNQGDIDIDKYIIPFKIMKEKETKFRTMYDGENLKVGTTAQFRYDFNISCEDLPHIEKYEIDAYALDNDHYQFADCDKYKCQSGFIKQN